MLNYLRITKLRVGVILDFKHRKLEWQRIACNIRVHSCVFVVNILKASSAGLPEVPAYKM